MHKLQSHLLEYLKYLGLNTASFQMKRGNRKDQSLESMNQWRKKWGGMKAATRCLSNTLDEIFQTGMIWFCKVWSATTFTTFWHQIKIWHCWRGSTVNFFTCCHLSALSKVICFSWELSDQGQEWQRVNKQWFLQRQSIKSFTQSFRSKMSLPQRWVCACVVLMVRYRCNFKISAFYLHNTFVNVADMNNRF